MGRECTVFTSMISRTSLTVKGGLRSRTIVRVIEVPTAPRICLTASVRFIPMIEFPSMEVIKSPAITPARAAGVPSIGEMTLTAPSSLVTSRPRPPYCPRVSSRMSPKLDGSR